jgi:uncharacterized protein
MRGGDRVPPLGRWKRHSGDRAVIIDCHTHLSRFAEADGATLAERHGRLCREMDGAGVTHAVILTSALFGEDDPSPEAVLGRVDGDPRFAVVGGVDCPEGRPRNLEGLRALLEAGRLRGLKLYPGYQPFFVHDPALRPVYELAAERRVPVMIHTGDTFRADARVRQAHPLTVDEVAVDFREVTFVLCHTGNPWFTDAMEVMYKNENVVADISGFTVGRFQPRYAALVRARLAEVAAYLDRPDKLMFGTDWPIAGMDDYLAFARSLELSEAEREGLLWRNAARVFGFAALPD